MTLSWILSMAGLYVTTVGALLIFLYLWNSPRFADAWLTPDGKRAYTKHRRLVVAAVGLLSAWLVLEYVSLILL